MLHRMDKHQTKLNDWEIVNLLHLLFGVRKGTRCYGTRLWQIITSENHLKYRNVDK
jgi:hypothetical protein